MHEVGNNSELSKPVPDREREACTGPVTGDYNMSLFKDLLERPFDQAITSRYTAMNGLIYLGAGTLVVIWPGMVQTIFRDAAFVGNEAALIRVMGMTVMVIGWLYLFGGLSGGRRIVAASVLDRVVLVPLVLVPLSHRGSFSSFSARVCGSRPDARHWRLAASQSIGPPWISLGRRYAIAVARLTEPRPRYGVDGQASEGRDLLCRAARS